MGFDFAWYDEARLVMCYTATGNWNWRDYHHCVRASHASLYGLDEGVVDSIIDLRESTREAMPSGLPAHVRTFGKRLHPAFSGRAVVIGMPHDAEKSLEPVERRLATADGEIRFVDDEDAARAILAAWRTGQTS
jgi:hypothetical protein